MMKNSSNNHIELKPHHCGISVPDLEESVAWYRDILEFSEALRLTLGEASGTKIAFMKHGDFYIELFEVADAEPLPDSMRRSGENLAIHGMKHICFVVNDMRQTINLLKQRGVSFVRDVSDQETPKAVHIRDNAGNIIELVPPEAPEPL